jgi:hypothetical protein
MHLESASIGLADTSINPMPSMGYNNSLNASSGSTGRKIAKATFSKVRGPGERTRLRHRNVRAATRCRVASHNVQWRLFRGGVIALLGIQPEGCLRHRSYKVNFKSAPLTVSAALARVITKNVLIAQFVADLGDSA